MTNLELNTDLCCIACNFRWIRHRIIAYLMSTTYRLCWQWVSLALQQPLCLEQSMRFVHVAGFLQKILLLLENALSSCHCSSVRTCQVHTHKNRDSCTLKSRSFFEHGTFLNLVDLSKCGWRYVDCSKWVNGGEIDARNGNRNWTADTDLQPLGEHWKWERTARVASCHFPLCRSHAWSDFRYQGLLLPCLRL